MMALACNIFLEYKEPFLIPDQCHVNDVMLKCKCLSGVCSRSETRPNSSRWRYWSQMLFQVGLSLNKSEAGTCGSAVEAHRVREAGEEEVVVFGGDGLHDGGQADPFAF